MSEPRRGVRFQIALRKDRCPAPIGRCILRIPERPGDGALLPGTRGGSNQSAFVTHNVNFDFIRDDPRFQAILEGMGLAD